MLQTADVQRAEALLAELAELRIQLQEWRGECERLAVELGWVGNPQERRVSAAKTCEKHVSAIEREIVGAYS
jgi:hypothetical protein